MFRYILLADMTILHLLVSLKNIAHVCNKFKWYFRFEVIR